MARPAEDGLAFFFPRPRSDPAPDADRGDAETTFSNRKGGAPSSSPPLPSPSPFVSSSACVNASICDSPTPSAALLLLASRSVNSSLGAAAYRSRDESSISETRQTTARSLSGGIRAGDFAESRDGAPEGCWGVRPPEDDAGDWDAPSPGATVLGRRDTREEYASVRTDD